ncbi:MAG: polyprenol monophosphomannose synthase [Gemmatimonadota bacterium]|jgi:dolichol-phosphate mannosyltransferase|nr:polyprenol monophosphomannose synthase [Gemmatimonadota bacterium]
MNAETVAAFATMARRISGEQRAVKRNGPLFPGGQEDGRALVIVPTYNERTNLERLVSQVLQQSDRIDVLVVDDNSPDGTGQLADRLSAGTPRVQVLHRPGKAGLGKAYLAGFAWGLARPQYDCFFEMDADFSHEPAHLPAFLEAIRSADLVLGSRYDQGKVTVVNWPITRLLLSYGANIYARWVTGVRLDDATGGFKCFRRSVLAAIDLADVRSNGYAFQIEMSVRASAKGFSIAQIPIVFTDRTEGQSKMSGHIVREAIFMCWRLRWWTLTGRLAR